MSPVTAVTSTDPRGAPKARPGLRFRTTFIGVVPFFAFALLFMILPVAFLVAGSFQSSQTKALTLENYADLGDPNIVLAFSSSIEISLVTAVVGGLLGFLLAYAVILGGLPRIFRGAVMTFSGVASNFAGIPLALAFTFTIGYQGLLTKFLLWDPDHPLLNLYGKPPDGLGFSLYTKLGLEIVYLYFQFPLMVLIIAPAIDGLKKEWREASENMGASSAQYWRYVALPVLTPTILGSIILLFGNAFGAQATAYQLTAGLVPLVTNLISAQISGDVFHNVNLGYAMAMGMVIIMAITITGYSILQRRAERWLR
jgi:putative spermidine/putrescine transport system permease protein